MLTTSLVIAALIVGAVVGFIVGRRTPKVDPAQFRRVPRQPVADTPAPREGSLADELLDGGTRVDTPVVVGRRTHVVTCPADYVGVVHVLVAHVDGEPADTDVEIVWGAANAVSEIKNLGTAGVALVFTKDSADNEDAQIEVRTSTPTACLASLGGPVEGAMVGTLTWK
jgi:hypothetical protein